MFPEKLIRRSNTREIIVIDPSLIVPEVSSFNRLQRTSHLPITYHLPHFNCSGDYLSLEPEQIAGVVIFGSAASVNDSREWQEILIKWLFDIIFPLNIPIFGICYGHQLLHKVMGGEIKYVLETGVKQTEVRKVRLNSAAGLPLLNLEGEIIFSHCEHVVKSGIGFELWAKSDGVPIEASFHNKHPIWTMQSHPEACHDFYATLGISMPLSNFGWEILAAFMERLNSKEIYT